jgi:hypothetical protein
MDRKFTGGWDILVYKKTACPYGPILAHIASVGPHDDYV